MNMKPTLLTVAAACSLAGIALAEPTPGHIKTLVNVNRRGVALEGRDPVTYFIDGKPLKGDPKIEATYDGALYHFVSQEHREIFERDPAKYTPAFGGFCGYAASINKVRPVDVNRWSIVDGRLILQHSKQAVALWNQDVRGNLGKADRNWPGLVERETAQKMARSRYPLTWPGFYDYSSQRRAPASAAGGSLAVPSSGRDRMPIPGDLDWPGF